MQFDFVGPSVWKETLTRGSQGAEQTPDLDEVSVALCDLTNVDSVKEIKKKQQLKDGLKSGDLTGRLETHVV